MNKTDLSIAIILLLNTKTKKKLSYYEIVSFHQNFTY